MCIIMSLNAIQPIITIFLFHFQYLSLILSVLSHILLTSFKTLVRLIHVTYIGQNFKILWKHSYPKINAQVGLKYLFGLIT